MNLMYKKDMNSFAITPNKTCVDEIWGGYSILGQNFTRYSIYLLCV